jgi:hypothetical protein
VKVTIIVCDNCRQTIQQVSEGQKAPRKFRIGTVQKDICTDCQEILLHGQWVSLDWVKVEMKDTTDELTKFKIGATKRKGDLIKVREEIADAIDAWSVGRDEQGRELLTAAATRVVKYTE